MTGPAEVAASDAPWYSFDYGPVHFTIASTEHGTTLSTPLTHHPASAMLTPHSRTTLTNSSSHLGVGISMTSHFTIASTERGTTRSTPLTHPLNFRIPRGGRPSPASLSHPPTDCQISATVSSQYQCLVAHSLTAR